MDADTEQSYVVHGLEGREITFPSWVHDEEDACEYEARMDFYPID